MKVRSLLTAIRSACVRAWRSLRTTRQRIEAGVAFVAAVACIVVAAMQVGPALAEPKVEGKPVPDTLLASIVLGTTSCPALTGERLAAQLMAASEFEVSAVSDTGEGLAGMDAEQWAQWAPWPDAQRSDARANVLALAHQTCELVGQVRAAGVDADHWEAAVAARKVGLQAVATEKRIPDAAAEHVDLVVGYSNWYADQPQFAESGAEPAPAVASAAAGTGVPEEYLDAVRRAGQVCPAAISPARIAAQLMALSGFNPNMRGDDRQGIAQFTTQMWKQYAPKNASVWDPQDAIPALGTAMCDLKNQLSGMRLKGAEQADSYTLALAAYQWGMTAVRAEAGVPRKASVPQLADQVDAFLPVYSADTRLSTAPPSPPTSAPASPSPSPTAAGPSPTGSPSPSPESSTPAAPAAPAVKTWDPTISYQFVNALSGRILEVPGTDNITAGGTTMQLWDNLREKDMFWHIANAEDPAYVVITNAHNNKALGIRDGSVDNSAEVVMLDPAFADHNQQWQLVDGGDQGYFLINRKSGKAVDMSGDDCCAGNGASVQQYDRQDHAVDQHWKVVQ
ncbi:RICIN domain-containing protein [Catenuloplanes atrovinosus]|uniref:Ricin B lectin domain-containing protein n=1 Tax=Catenuloplanes atrovinosus TaxID=137266 RepID=A0AAE4C8X9_9ACTN|nr:RICIN domain-containing protein [Catenuloplanes atrovinosus]MDR7274259.1 hypothetical protein [Catenuloplanes atrovinosus]